MAFIKYYVTTSDKLDSINVEVGNLIFVEDERSIYLDGNDGRVSYQQIITLQTEAQRTALPHPVKGFYFILETRVLWNFNGNWIQMTVEPEKQIIFASHADFPAVGDEETIYIDGTSMYRWLEGSYQLMNSSSGSIDWGIFS